MKINKNLNLTGIKQFTQKKTEKSQEPADGIVLGGVNKDDTILMADKLKDMKAGGNSTLGWMFLAQGTIVGIMLGGMKGGAAGAIGGAMAGACVGLLVGGVTGTFSGGPKKSDYDRIAEKYGW